MVCHISLNDMSAVLMERCGVCFVIDLHLHLGHLADACIKAIL